jgi:dephospho-CoA kinase
MLKIGITGGIGSGKTMVCRIFETLSIPVFYADDESKRILFTDRSVLNQVMKIFGDEVFSNGIPDRKKLATIVFSNPEKLRQLNSILHSNVFQHFDNWMMEKKDSPYILMEAALIYETAREDFLDKVIVVSAPEEIRIRRIRVRDKISEADIRARMKQQYSQELKEQKADFIIENDENQLLIPQVMDIHEKILFLAKGNN